MSKPRGAMSKRRRVEATTAARFRYRLLETPTGLFAVMRNSKGQLGAAWVTDTNDPLLRDGEPDEQLNGRLIQRLHAYFDGQAANFADVPTPDGPAFFQRCWEACRVIPCGETLSYGELARLAGRSPRAARAAGQAMRRNPLPIIVPCHRVIGSTGRLIGFAGSRDPSGTPIDRKRWLLAHERATGSPASTDPATSAHAI
jgi:methylated-DNA-[protein]-cysteine S-methyltransferase